MSDWDRWAYETVKAYEALKRREDLSLYVARETAPILVLADAIATLAQAVAQAAAAETLAQAVAAEIERQENLRKYGTAGKEEQDE